MLPQNGAASLKCSWETSGKGALPASKSGATTTLLPLPRPPGTHLDAETGPRNQREGRQTPAKTETGRERLGNPGRPPTPDSTREIVVWEALSGKLLETETECQAPSHRTGLHVPRNEISDAETDGKSFLLSRRPHQRTERK